MVLEDTQNAVKRASALELEPQDPQDHLENPPKFTKSWLNQRENRANTHCV